MSRLPADPERDPILAEGEYPGDQELRRIRTWPIESVEDCRALLSYLERRWRWPSYFTHRGRIYRVSTGGWSGHEDMIGALEANRIFMVLCWQSSRRGGHNVYRVPR